MVSGVARVMIVDNYDSFTYNLMQYFGELGAEVVVTATTRSMLPASRPCSRRTW
jgi:anthranilate/para-aminobenzoate synthase component II